jgi:hypothetical protein
MNASGLECFATNSIKLRPWSYVSQCAMMHKTYSWV